MQLLEFLNKRESTFHIAYIEQEGLNYEDIKHILPTNHFHLPLIREDGTYGISALVGHLWKMAPKSVADEMGGFLGKVIKSLYPHADIDVEPYPDIDGPIVYYAIGYLLQRIAQHTGNEHPVWILSEFPFDENNHMVKLLETIKHMNLDRPHHIVVITDKVVDDSATRIDIGYDKPTPMIPKGEKRILLTYIALLGLPSYGYVLKKSLRRLLLHKRKFYKLYKELVEEGYLEEWGALVRFTDRRIYRELLDEASDEDILHILSILDRKTPGSMYARTYLYTRLGNHKRALASMKIYISMMKRRRLYRLAHTHMEPIVKTWFDKLSKTDIEMFLYLAGVAEYVSDLEIKLIEKLLTEYTPSPVALFTLSWIYDKLPAHLKRLVKETIDKQLQTYHPIRNSLLAHAMLLIIYKEKDFYTDKAQRYTLFIGTTDFGDPEINVRGCVVRSRINLVFHKDNEALKDLEKGIRIAKEYNIPWHLSILYNNLAILLSRNSIDSHLDISLLTYKAYETSFAYSIEGSIIPFANYIFLSTPLGKKHSYIINIWETFKPILSGIMEPKDYIAVLWALAHLQQQYGYYQQVKDILQEMEKIVKKHEKAIPSNYIALYYWIAAEHSLENGDLQKATVYLSKWQEILGDKYDHYLEHLMTLKDAIFAEDDKIYDQSYKHVYYSSVRTGKYIEGINKLKEIKKDLLRNGKLTEIAQLELFLGALYKMEGNLPAYHTHLHNALSIYMHIEAAHAKYIAEVLRIPSHYIEADGLKNLAGIHVSQLLITAVSTILASSTTIEDLLKKVLAYLTLPSSHMWIMYTDGNEKYFMEYSIFKGIGQLMETHIKNPDKLLRSRKIYELCHLPSYIYIKKQGEGGTKLIIYAENKYIEKAFSEEYLAWLDMWADMVLSLLENIRIGEKAIKDALTDVHTRWYISQILEREIALAKREKTPLSVLFIDIDNFKRINDTLGHLEGDRILAMVASAIKNSIRITDYVGRYGGEEFVVVLPDTHEDEARLVAKRIQTAIKENTNIPTTVSIGISTYYPRPKAKVSLHKLIRQADMAMYHAKQMGKNLILHYDELKTY
ncbi:diguanylate cyclase [bacterium 3DAC]|nr:diguanylate cyclase [bacterium 3DAC]